MLLSVSCSKSIKKICNFADKSTKRIKNGRTRFKRTNEKFLGKKNSNNINFIQKTKEYSATIVYLSKTTTEVQNTLAWKGKVEDKENSINYKVNDNVSVFDFNTLTLFNKLPILFAKSAFTFSLKSIFKSF